MTTAIAIEYIRREVKILRLHNAYEDEDNVHMVME